ncbi:MAG: DDE-type integrase/transposase/recombinase [Chloroflexi bacterium]|nr:DDE-type integrase/transposase/recombinase [Chloroflexota bacterium]
MTNTALLVMSWELYGQGMNKSQIARQLGKHRETIGIGVNNIETYGLLNFLDRYEQAKKGERKKRQVDPVIKRLVWHIREREYECCGQKIQYFLNLEHGIHLSVPKIYEILAEKYVIRSKWKKNKSRGDMLKAERPREVIQMDAVDFGDLYAFTAIDTFTREADVFMAPNLTASFGYQFLSRSMKRRLGGHVHLLQTDGGPEFKAEFKKNLHLFCDRYRVSKPYRKNEQSYIESFNRTLRKECLGWWKYNANELSECTDLVESFLMRYHYHRHHMSLMMRPPLLNFNGG